MAEAEPDADAADPSHVPHIYRGVVFARTTLGWYLCFAVVWAVAVGLSAPWVGAGFVPSSPTNSAPALELDLIGGGFLLALLVALPLGVRTVLFWRRSVGALFRDVPATSPWVPAVLRPIRRDFRIAGAAVASCAALGVLEIGLSYWVLAAWFDPSYATDLATANAVGTAALAVIAVLQALTQVLTVRSFALLIGGSEVREIDRRLRNAVRAATYAAPWMLVPVVVLAVVVADPSGAGWIPPYVSAVALLSPVGLALAVVWLRKAYAEWIGLAFRLVGRREVV
jgi:hypothetical protein